MNIIGKRFGKLIVLEETDERKHGSKVYKCQCDCGNITYVARTNLMAKNGTKSCGCTHKISHNKTHGKTGTRLYRIWVNMKTRCYNKNRIQYKDWGGRGIGVCDEWKDDFMAFYKWAYDNGYNDSLSIGGQAAMLPTRTVCYFGKVMVIFVPRFSCELMSTFA